MDIHCASPRRLAAILCGLLAAPAAFAHDMGNVLIAYGLVLALPLPALVVLLRWKWGVLAALPVWAAALYLMRFGYAFFYGVLFAPYAVWLGRALWTRKPTREPHEV